MGYNLNEDRRRAWDDKTFQAIARCIQAEPYHQSVTPRALNAIIANYPDDYLAVYGASRKELMQGINLGAKSVDFLMERLHGPLAEKEPLLVAGKRKYLLEKEEAALGEALSRFANQFGLDELKSTTSKIIKERTKLGFV